MQILHLKIDGRIPSTKNNRRNFRRTSLPSERATQWQETAASQILQYRGMKIAKSDIQFEFWMPDNRKTDLDNKVTSLLDLLKNLEVIKDDSWQCVPSIYACCRGISKEMPRVEIWIKELN